MGRYKITTAILIYIFNENDFSQQMLGEMKFCKMYWKVYDLALLNKACVRCQAAVVMYMTMMYIVRIENIVCHLKNQELVQIDSKFHTKRILTSTSTVCH